MKAWISLGWNIVGNIWNNCVKKSVDIVTGIITDLNLCYELRLHGSRAAPEEGVRLLSGLLHTGSHSVRDDSC